MIDLYLETNYILSVATGRDEHAPPLLEPGRPMLTVLMPGICCMEALSVLEGERRQRHAFQDSLRRQIGQLQRDGTSEHAAELRSLLERSLIEDQAWFDDTEARLLGTLDRIAAHVELIPLTGAILRRAAADPLLVDPTDNLILGCILEDAARRPGEIKAFLSGNFRDFDTSGVRKAFAEVGVEKYFRSASTALGWLESLPGR